MDALSGDFILLTDDYACGTQIERRHRRLKFLAGTRTKLFEFNHFSRWLCGIPSPCASISRLNGGIIYQPIAEGLRHATTSDQDP